MEIEKLICRLTQTKHMQAGSEMLFESLLIPIRCQGSRHYNGKDKLLDENKSLLIGRKCY